MVTSSAVVGSSAMTIFGLHAIAMAIITLWRMPPENSCGYCLSRASGSGISTSLSSSSARAFACARFMCWWMRSGSISWFWTVNSGFKLVIGS